MGVVVDLTLAGLAIDGTQQALPWELGFPASKRNLAPQILMRASSGQCFRLWAPGYAMQQNAYGMAMPMQAPGRPPGLRA